LRLLAEEGLFATETKEPLLFLRRVPDDLPVDVPLPEGAVVVGSVVRDEEDGGRMVEIVLDAEGPAGRLREAYEEQASAGGWGEPEVFGPEGGFEHGPVGSSLLLCRDPREPALYFSVRRLKGSAQSLDVRIRLIAGRHSPCAQRPRRRGFEPESVIPRLSPPPEARPSRRGSGGGGSSDGEEHANTSLEIDFAPAAVEAHYARQLESAGWMRSDGGSDGPMAWSTWTFADDEGQAWEGLFTALRLSEASGRYFLQVNAELTSN